MKRIEALDFTRTIAMLSVVLIHTTSTFINAPSNYTILGMNAAFILNQWSRFAVPLFILISGISLSLSSHHEGTLRFWKRRIFKVSIPYLGWFFIYSLYNCGFRFHLFITNITENPLAFIRSLLLGQCAPHLYFIVIIIQCYLLYPFLAKAISSSKYKTIGFAFITTYLIQALYVFKRHQLDLIPNFIEPYLWLLFPTWCFYFILGAAMNRTILMQIRTFAYTHSQSIITVTTLYSVLFVIEANLLQSLDSIKHSLNLYVILLLLSSLSLWKTIEKHLFFRKITLFLAEHSMSIYFSHVLVLCYFRRHSFFCSGTLGMLSLFIVVLAFSIVISFAIDTCWAKLYKQQL